MKIRMHKGKSSKYIDFLRKKALWVRRETLKIHKIAKDTRLASSLSAVEIFVVLYYGKILKFLNSNANWQHRDRFIISKGHGAICFYPILADLGLLPKDELSRVCKAGSILGSIPDPVIPGFETINGSLGHGLGVACGMAIALKKKKSKSKVFVLLGDGELNEGSIWEAIMFAGEHRLDNLIAIIDNNKVCMLDFCKNVLDLDPLSEKFRVFKWKTAIVDGHNLKKLYYSLLNLKHNYYGKPKVLIAQTMKGKGVPALEKDSLSHIKSLQDDEIDVAIANLK
jgi:transketolase